MMRKQILQKLDTIVVKVGTSVLGGRSGNISRVRMRKLVSEIAELRKKGKKVVLVSSGAIAYGMEVLGMKKRPTKLAQLQACASVGQSKMMKIYEGMFLKKGYNTAQLLLTRDGFDQRSRYVNTKNTLDELLRLGVVPIINENDTVSTEEINFGDNDVLASQVAALVHADLLVLLSDIDGLYYESSGKRKVFSFIDHIDEGIKQHLFAKKNERTRGGMESKLDAADRLMRAGIPMIVANGKTKDILLDIVSGVNAGTLFSAGRDKKNGFKNWLALSAQLRGRVMIDGGAYDAIVRNGKSLLAAGIDGVDGTFHKGDIVSIVSRLGKECARGVINYSSVEVQKIKGKKQDAIKDILLEERFDEVVHRDNLVVLA